MTHICVGKLNIISSDNGLSPGKRQAIIWTNAGILFIWHLWTNFIEILIRIQIFSFQKCTWNVVCEMASILSRPQCDNWPGASDITLRVMGIYGYCYHSKMQVSADSIHIYLSKKYIQYSCCHAWSCLVTVECCSGANETAIYNMYGLTEVHRRGTKNQGYDQRILRILSKVTTDNINCISYSLLYRGCMIYLLETQWYGRGLVCLLWVLEMTERYWVPCNRYDQWSHLHGEESSRGHCDNRSCVADYSIKLTKVLQSFLWNQSAWFKVACQM